MMTVLDPTPTRRPAAARPRIQPDPRCAERRPRAPAGDGRRRRGGRGLQAARRSRRASGCVDALTHGERCVCDLADARRAHRVGRLAPAAPAARRAARARPPRRPAGLLHVSTTTTSIGLLHDTRKHVEEIAHERRRAAGGACDAARRRPPRRGRRPVDARRPRVVAVAGLLTARPAPLAVAWRATRALGARPRYRRRRSRSRSRHRRAPRVALAPRRARSTSMC